MGWADPMDQASELETVHNATALSAARAKNKPEQEQAPDGTWETTECVDCGEDIEPKRLEMGRIRCFHCQNTLEKKRRMYGR